MWKDQFKIKIKIKQSKTKFKGLENEGLNIFPCLLNLVPNLARKKINICHKFKFGLQCFNYFKLIKFYFILSNPFFLT